MCEPDTTLSVKYEPQFRAAPLQIDRRHIGLSPPPLYRCPIIPAGGDTPYTRRSVGGFLDRARLVGRQSSSCSIGWFGIIFLRNALTFRSASGSGGVMGLFSDG